MKEGAVLFWPGPVRVGASGARCWPGMQYIGGLAALPDGALLAAAMGPFLALLEADGTLRWAHPSPTPTSGIKTNAGGVGGRRDC